MTETERKEQILNFFKYLKPASKAKFKKNTETIPVI